MRLHEERWLFNLSRHDMFRKMGRELKPFLITALLLTTLQYLFVGDSSAILAALVTALTMLPGYLASRLLLPESNRWDFIHLVGAFSFSLAIFSVATAPFLLFHSSSSLAFTTATAVLIISSFLLLWRLTRREATSHEQGNEKESLPEKNNFQPDTKLYVLSLVGVFCVAAFWFYREPLTGKNWQTQGLIFAALLIFFGVLGFFLSRRTENPKIELTSPNRILRVLLIAMLVLLVTIHIFKFLNSDYWDPDNTTHQGMIADYVNSQHLNEYESSLGENLRPYPAYLTPTWELYNAYISSISGVEPFRIYNHFLPILLILIIYSAAWGLLKSLLGKSHPMLFTGLLTVAFFNIWGRGVPLGNEWSVLSPLYTIIRINQSKCIFMFILFPFLVALYIRYIRKEDKKNFIPFFAVALLSAFLHLMAFVFTAAIIGADLVHRLLMRGDRSLRRSLFPFVGLIPGVLSFLLFTLSLTEKEFKTLADNAVLDKQTSIVQDATANFSIWLMLLIVMVFFARLRKKAEWGYISITSFCLMPIFTLPPVGYIIMRIGGGEYAKRLTTVVPIYIIIGLWFSIPYIFRVSEKKTVKIAALVLPPLILILPVFSNLGGQSFQEIQFDRAKNIYKIREDYAPILDYYAKLDRDVQINVIAQPRTSSARRNISLMLPQQIANMAEAGFAKYMAGIPKSHKAKWKRRQYLSELVPTVHGRSKMYASRLWTLYYYMPELVRERSDFLNLVYYQRDINLRIKPHDFNQIVKRFSATDFILRQNRYNSRYYAGLLKKLGYKSVKFDVPFVIYHKNSAFFAFFKHYFANFCNFSTTTSHFFHQFRYSMTPPEAEYFSSLPPEETGHIYTWDFARRYHFGRGWDIISLYPYDLQYLGRHKGLEKQSLAFYRLVEDKAVLFLNLAPGKTYNITLRMLGIRGKDKNDRQKVRISVDGKPGDEYTLNEPPELSEVTFAVDRNNTSESVCRVELAFDRVEKTSLLVPIGRRFKFSAAVFDVIFEPDRTTTTIRACL